MTYEEATELTKRAYNRAEMHWNRCLQCDDAGRDKANRNDLCETGRMLTARWDHRRNAIHTGEVIGCPAQSETDPSCICKSEWGHKSVRITSKH